MKKFSYKGMAREIGMVSDLYRVLLIVKADTLKEAKLKLAKTHIIGSGTWEEFN